MNPLRKSLVIALGVTLAACTEPKPPGALVLSYSTAIGDELPFSWILSVDDRAPMLITSATTASAKFDSMSAGSHRLRVTNLPKACTTGTDDREIDIPSSDTLRLTIKVTCTRVTGDASLRITTAGGDPDPDGYTVLVDGVPRFSIPSSPTFTVLVTKLTPGNHLFGLAGVASNCSVTNGGTSAVVSVGSIANPTLAVECTAITGTLRVTTTTTGDPSLIDPSGYQILASIIRNIPANGTTSFAVPAGPYTIVLNDIEPNCSSTATSKSVSIAVGVTTDIAFDVTCAPYAATTAALSATDPTVDTLPNSTNNASKSFDLTGLTTRYASNYMTVTLRFNRAIGTEQLVGYVEFDLDENAGTGVPPIMNSFGGSAPQGTEAHLSFVTGTTPQANVQLNSGGPGVVRITVDADSVRFTIPFVRLGNDDGNATITAIIGTPDRPTDFMPNTGVLVSHAPPSPNASTRQVTIDRPSPGTKPQSPLKLFWPPPR